jgi:fumarate hydratase class II
MGQSSNETFPTAMHIAAVGEISERLVPNVEALHDAISSKAAEWVNVVKIGRTHLEDAVPLTVGQEWSGYATQLSDAVDRVSASLPGLYELAAGGTAVGTGLNAPDGFGVTMASQIADLTGYPFVTVAQQICRPGGIGCHGGCLSRAAVFGGRPDEDCQRRALARLRSPLRDQRACAPGE